MKTTKPAKGSQNNKVSIDFGAPCPPTKKQLEFISDIELYTNIQFLGETKEEASKYISENIEQYRFLKDADEFDYDDDIFYPQP
jgi:hypothetical protein